MGTKRLLFLLVFAVIYFGCSNDNQVTSPNPSTTGQVLLKIDRSNTPEGIVLVTATLSRENFPLITASLNLLSDTTADLSLSSIPVGEWLLTVEAKDSVDEVKYRGEANVTIMESMITQVSLTLSPTSTGTGLGSIYIFVNWGDISTLWSDYYGNPIISYIGNNYDSLGVGQPQVIFDGQKYRMYYVGIIAAARKYVLYAESMNGINWTRPLDRPVLYPGEYGSWDSLAVHPGAVIKDGNIYKMYYSGWSYVYGRWDIGLATSTDGINFVKYPFPVMSGTNSGWEYRIAPSSIVKKDNIYYLYYSGGLMTSNDRKIGLATSTDGINWIRYPGNPILTKTQSWEIGGPFYPSVIVENSIFKMVYATAGSVGFGSAVSTDGKNWTKSNDNPFFTREMTTNNWALLDVNYPQYTKFNNEYRIYYSGFDSSSNGKYKIGFTKKL